MKASVAAQTDHFIHSLSGGYQFELQEGGNNISFKVNVNY